MLNTDLNTLHICIQKRFERSEKYSLVSEPGDKRGAVSSISTGANEAPLEVNNSEKESTDLHDSDCESHEVVDIEKDSENQSQEQISVPVELDAIAEPTTMSFLVTPQPWKFKSEPLPPPLPQTDFNRSPRGFAGTYLSPYFQKKQFNGMEHCACGNNFLCFFIC